MANPDRRDRREFGVVVVMLIVLAVSGALALGTVSRPSVVLQHAPYGNRWGYTISLVLFFIPSLTIAGWFLHEKAYAIERRAFIPAFLTGFFFGCVLDVVFGNTFFVFKNIQATLGILLPGYVPGRGFEPTIPIEEFAFYALGFATILLVYVWGDLYWFGAYSAHDLKQRGIETPRLVQVHWPSAAIAAGVLAIGYAYRFLGPPRATEGFPGYFTFLVVGGALPALLVFPSVKALINWRAMSFTIIVLLFISLLWEATLGVPYSWWGYRDVAMLGIFIEAWAHLPVEAVLVWISASFGAVIAYEALRLRLYIERPLREALFGQGTPRTPAAEKASGR